jgi:excisionase family DNA binding protein
MSRDAGKPSVLERLLTIDEVAAILGVSKRTVMRMLDDGRLRKVKGLGRSVRIHPRALRRLENDE